jgi:hypothetical protein
MREQHRVTGADPFVEVDLALRGFDLEIGGYIAYA